MSDPVQNESRRINRVERAVREAVSSYLISGFKGTLKGLVTVTRVDVSTDLQKTRIHVSVLGSDEDRRVSFENLHDYAVDIQNFIGREVKLRYCPRVTILEDRSNDGLTLS